MALDYSGQLSSSTLGSLTPTTPKPTGNQPATPPPPGSFMPTPAPQGATKPTPLVPPPAVVTPAAAQANNAKIQSDVNGIKTAVTTQQQAKDLAAQTAAQNAQTKTTTTTPQTDLSQVSQQIKDALATPGTTTPQHIVATDQGADAQGNKGQWVTNPTTGVQSFFSSGTVLPFDYLQTTKTTLPSGQQGFVDANGNFYNQSGTPIDSASASAGTDLIDYQKNVAQVNAQSDANYQDMQKNVSSIMSGTFPLNSWQQSLVNSIQQQLQQNIAAQKIANANYEGGVQVSLARSGMSQYSPQIAQGELMAAVSAGVAKIADLESKASQELAKVEEGFAKDDYDMVMKSYDATQTYLKQKGDELKNLYDETVAANDKVEAANKAATDRKYNEVTKPINDIALEAAKNDASPEVQKAIQNAGSVQAAIAAAGDSLQTATGQLGDYLQYKRDAEKNGLPVTDYATWKAKDDARASKVKSDEAYATAFATAKGKAAGEYRADAPTSPVTSPLGIEYSAPASVAPYVQFADNGVKYVDLSAFKGTPTEANVAVQDAQKAGYKVITNKNSALDVQNITDAMAKLRDMKDAFSQANAGNATQRDLFMAGVNSLENALQSNTQLAGVSVYQDIALDVLKAMSGTQGFRGGTSMVSSVQSTFPKITDTADVANAKIDNIMKLIDDRQTSLIGKPSASDQALIDAQNEKNSAGAKAINDFTGTTDSTTSTDSLFQGLNTAFGL